MKVVHHATLRDKLALLPERSGCYLMKDQENNVIYVGKANVLKNRVRSYFTGSHDAKTERLVQDIHDFEYIVTTNALEAFILECNLIKQYRPKYNVLLKDDKTFPYIKITADEHPRLEIVRRVLPDKAKYFGPYPNATAAHQTKKLLDRLYPLRKCTTLPQQVCLYYHMKQCLAPCVFVVEQSTYDEMIREITRFLRGGQAEIRQELHVQMLEAAEQMRFERAQALRDTIYAIDALMQRQHVSTLGGDRDVIGYAVQHGWMAVHLLYVRDGKMIARKATTFPYYGEAYGDFLTYVAQYYHDHPARPPEVNLPARPAEDAQDHAQEMSGERLHEDEVVQSFLQAYQVKVHIPKIGPKFHMVQLACDNARLALDEQFRLIARNHERTTTALQQLCEAIGVRTLHRIEAFDNSNIQGVDPVSVMVVMVDGVWERKQYRKYVIRSVKGADDYATMREVIRRRYVRVLREQLPLPDLILVDGGKGQIQAAREVLHDELGLDIPVCGLAKDTKHKFAQLLGGFPPVPLHVPRDSPVFYLLQRIQDEVHRFAIAFHRTKRTQSTFSSALDAIEGIGAQRKKALLRHFGSVQQIKKATVEQFGEISIGRVLAQKILDALHASPADEKHERSPPNQEKHTST